MTRLLSRALPVSLAASVMLCCVGAPPSGGHPASFGFDEAIPSQPTLRSPAGWVKGTDAAWLEIDPPTRLPLAGLRGYALSMDRGNASPPCLSAIGCEAEEIDVAGDAGGRVSLGILPEGLHFARVVAVSGSGVASTVATAELRVDATAPVVALQGAPVGWSAGPVQLTAVAKDRLSGMAPAGSPGPFTAIAVDGTPAGRWLGDAMTTWVGGSGVHEVRYFARDAAGNVGADGGGTAETATALVRVDEDPPTVVFSAAQDPAEPERIEASVRDALSGPGAGRGSIAVRPSGTSRRFEQLPTRVAADRLIAHWDSDAYPPGKYEFLATGFDAAGNAGTGAYRARGGRMFLLNPLKTSTLLDAGFVGGRVGAGPSPVARFGRGVRFGGRLRTAKGSAVAGAEVAVTEIFAGGSEPSRRTTLARTRGDGGFEVRLSPGPSREVVASFAGNRTLTRASSDRAQLRVPAAVRLHASSASARVGGPPVVFRGKVGREGVEPDAVGGLPVELQFRFGGGRWSEFRTVETDSRGSFRYAYRFSDDDSRGIRFQFRAYVKGRESWPYAEGTSRPVAVTGR